jgi:hypothetical protein
MESLGKLIFGNADNYIDAINPTGKRVPDYDSFHWGDMDGMLPRSAKEIGEKDGITYMQNGPDFYAMAVNPNTNQMEVIGHHYEVNGVSDLQVIDEMQGKGIGQELSYLYRKNNPMAPSGGLSEAGENVARKTYDRLKQEGYVGAAESGSGPSLMDRATGAAATVGDIATQTWDDMSLLDKAALVTSPIPFVGAGTGIAADVMNMVNNPEERTFLNAALLASNFIPGNKIAGAGMAMAEAGKKNFRKIVDTFQKVPEADRDALTAAFNQVEARLDQLRAKDEALKSNAQRRDDRYSKPQNLSESELAEYNALMERSVNASMAGRMGKTSEEILKELRGE